jgi:twitching motility protein PilT
MSAEMTLDSLLVEAVSRKASDLHLAVGQPPTIRVSGKLERLEYDAIDSGAMDALVLPVLPEPQRTAFVEGATPTAEATVADAGADLLFALFAFRSQGRIAATVRILSNAIPRMDLVAGTSQPLFERLAREVNGLVLFTGPAGSGKGTAAAAVVEEINRERAERIYVIDQIPVYVFEPKKSLTTHVYVGQDFDSFERAAQAILKGADPDVVVFGDLPTVEALHQALLLADTGHLVIAILTADGAAGLPRTLLGAFPEPPHLLPADLLARNLVAILNLRLMRRANRPGRVAAYEVLLGTEAVRSIIRDGADPAQLTAAMEAGGAEGMCTLDAALDALVEAGDVTAEAADGFRTDHRRYASAT